MKGQPVLSTLLACDVMARVASYLAEIAVEAIVWCEYFDISITPMRTIEEYGTCRGSV